MSIKQLPRLAFCLILLWVYPSQQILAEDDMRRPLRIELERLQTIQNSYWTQLLNQDVISAPAIGSQVNSQLYTIDFILNEINERADEAEQPRPTDVPQIPRLHPDVASRLAFFRERATTFVNSQINRTRPFNLNLTSMIPAPNGSHLRSDYPRNPLPSRNNLRCTTGGFVSGSIQPDVTGLVRNGSLMNEFKHWNDRVCKTPTTVSLYLDGQRVQVSCNPGNSSDPNVNSALLGMEMCDPLLYGFVPANLQTSGRYLGGCSYPNEEYIGRSFTYSDNIMAPDAANPSGVTSKCDLIAQGNISPGVVVPPGFNESDRSLYMAAKLAIENRQLFEQQKQRISQQCSDLSSRFLERDHCRNLLHRVSEVERVIQILQNPGVNPTGFTPVENEI